MHKNFSITVVGLERFLAAYLNVIFLKDKNTQDGLNILTRFEAVNQRNILRPIINDKYAEMFTNYDKDLDDALSTFEKHKVVFVKQLKLFFCLFHKIHRQILHCYETHRQLQEQYHGSEHY